MTRLHPPAALCMLLLLPSFQGSASDDVAVDAELKKLTQQYLDAIAPGQVEIWRGTLHDRVLLVTENNKVRDKPALLSELKPLPEGLVGRLQVGDFRTEHHGSTVVATYEARESLDYHGQVINSRWRSTDTWIKTTDGWRVVGQHIAAVLADPPSVSLPQTTLCAYAGEYTLTETIRTHIACRKDGLISVREGSEEAFYLAELKDVFFVPGRPRTRRIFLRDHAGGITGFVDRREGHDIYWKIIEHDSSNP